MNCSSTEARLERFLDDELRPHERRQIASHIDACAKCRGVLEELRVVDALLLTPRRVELAPNFTFAVMAEARTLGAPAPCAPPVRAYLVSYLAAAWLIAGAAAVLFPQLMHALGGTLVDVARSIADAVGGIGAVISRAFEHGANVLTAMLGALLALDATLVVVFGAALRFVRPRLAERLRS